MGASSCLRCFLVRWIQSLTSLGLVFPSLQSRASATFSSPTKSSCPPASCVPHYSTNILSRSMMTMWWNSLFVCLPNEWVRWKNELSSLTISHLPGWALGGLRSGEELLHSHNQAKSSETHWPVGGALWPSAEGGSSRSGFSGGASSWSRFLHAFYMHFLYNGMSQWLCDFSSLQQKLKKEISSDFRLFSVLKDQYRERRKTRV